MAKMNNAILNAQEWELVDVFTLYNSGNPPELALFVPSVESRRHIEYVPPIALRNFANAAVEAQLALYASSMRDRPIIWNGPDEEDSWPSGFFISYANSVAYKWLSGQDIEKYRFMDGDKFEGTHERKFRGLVKSRSKIFWGNIPFYEFSYDYVFVVRPK